MSNSPIMDDVKLSAEWCELMAAAHSNSRFIGHRTEDAKYAKALRIASRVLDPGAEEEVARVIARELTGGFPSGPKSIDHAAARAVLAWMRGEMGSSSAITAGSACGATEAQHSDGEG